MKMFQMCVAVFIACSSLVFKPTARAEVVYQHFTNEPSLILGFPGIDFDRDGTLELTFNFYALGHESGGVIFYDAHSAANTEVLLQAWGVLPLNWGETIPSTNSTRQWGNTGFGSVVWFQQFSSGLPKIIISPGGEISTNSLPPPPPGQGVGMPGFSNFMGVRFLLEDGWHYGWVRFGTPAGGFFFGPTLLDYAYESQPDTAILAGAGIDEDEDGVWDLVDECPNTPVGEIVNANGCSISQLVPCDGAWKNHGEYVQRIAKVVQEFRKQGWITASQARAILREAAQSDCGNRDYRRPYRHQPRWHR